jgi:hypothetical protein
VENCEAQSMNKDMLMDLADQVGRNLGNGDPEFARRMTTHSSQVAMEPFIELIARQFPGDDRDILEVIRGWVVYYEYLH